MAFEFTTTNSEGIEVHNFGVPGGIVYNCCSLAEHYNFPMITSIYDKGFYEGIEWTNKEIIDFKEECTSLSNILTEHLSNLSTEEQENNSNYTNSIILIAWILESIEVAIIQKGTIEIC